MRWRNITGCSAAAGVRCPSSHVPWSHSRPLDESREDQMPDRYSLPAVLRATSMSNTFLGNLIEVCFATEDCRQTMEGMVRLGIGPWRVYTFDGSTVTEREYGGQP